MNVKSIAVKAFKAMSSKFSSWRYWGKTPGEVVAMKRNKSAADRARRQRRKQWGRVKRRYPVGSHRRTS